MIATAEEGRNMRTGLALELSVQLVKHNTEQVSFLFLGQLLQLLTLNLPSCQVKTQMPIKCIYILASIP